jgi:hypothetical protein
VFCAMVCTVDTFSVFCAESMARGPTPRLRMVSVSRACAGVSLVATGVSRVATGGGNGGCSWMIF